MKDALRLATDRGVRREVGPISCSGGVTLRAAGEWLELVSRAAPGPEAPARPPGPPRAPMDELSLSLGRPGPWRVLREGPELVRIHDVPCPRGEEGLCEAGGGPTLDALEQIFDWAEATRDGRAPRPSPASREDVESWLEPAGLRVRTGAHLAAGELVHEPERLALVFPSLGVLPPDPPLSREAWLEALLLDAHRRWRLVRFGLDPGTRAVRAEVDLTGVPGAWARPFVQLSLGALRAAVEWVLAPLSFLLDPGTTSRALTGAPFQPLERSTVR